MQQAKKEAVDSIVVVAEERAVVEVQAKKAAEEKAKQEAAEAKAKKLVADAQAKKAAEVNTKKAAAEIQAKKAAEEKAKQEAQENDVIAIAQAAVKAARAQLEVKGADKGTAAADIYSYSFTSKPLGIGLTLAPAQPDATAVRPIIVKRVKREGTPIEVGHALRTVNGKDVQALGWSLQDVFADLKASQLPIEMSFKKQ